MKTFSAEKLQVGDLVISWSDGVLAQSHQGMVNCQRQKSIYRYEYGVAIVVAIIPKKKQVEYTRNGEVIDGFMLTLLLANGALIDSHYYHHSPILVVNR